MEPDSLIDSVIAEQIAYYKARAPEYDDWWERRNGYDSGPAFAAAWAADISELRDWLDGFAPMGDVLEIAAGTGNWTTELAQRAHRVTALDASREALDICEAKVTETSVEYEVADVFRWAPPRRYDVVFSSFWISHIPLSKWSGYWELVARTISPGGRVLIIDNAHPVYAASKGPATWAQAAGYQTGEDAAAGTRRVRRLKDGSAYVVEKHYWTPRELTDALASLGWQARVAQTKFAFVYGSAERAGGP